MPGITIEDVSLRDLHDLHQIEKECFGKEAFTRQQIASLLEDYNTISLAAKQEGAIVGFIIGSIYGVRDSEAGHILTVDVVSTHRRKGIGEQLLKAVERIFRGKGVRECSLEVREDNIAALHLYRKSRYIQVGKLMNYYGNSNGLLLMKNLNPA